MPLNNSDNDPENAIVQYFKRKLLNFLFQISETLVILYRCAYLFVEAAASSCDYKFLELKYRLAYILST